MPFNLLKKYPELLEILHMNEHQRKESLMRIYKRDIEDNPNFKFREKQIYPTRSDVVADIDNLRTLLAKRQKKQMRMVICFQPSEFLKKTVLNDCIGSIITFKNCLLKI